MNYTHIFRIGRGAEYISLQFCHVYILKMRMILKLKTRAVECENDCNESFDASDKDARGSYVTY